MSKFKMPKLAAFENGQLEIVAGHDNDWVVKKPEGLTQVWEHTPSGAELAIICARLEPGERVLVVCSMPLNDIHMVEEFLGSGDLTCDAEMDEYLKVTVKRALDVLDAKFAPKSKWGFDPEFEQAIELLAETPTTEEQYGSHQDQLVDTLIMAARTIITREKGNQNG